MTPEDAKARNMMIDYIMDVLDREEKRDIRTILELGSGEGTTYQLSQFFNMISIEDQKEWVGKYDSDYIYAPLVPYRCKHMIDWVGDKYTEWGWYDTDAVVPLVVVVSV